MSPNLNSEIPSMPKPERIEVLQQKEHSIEERADQERQDSGIQEKEVAKAGRITPQEDAFGSVTAPVPQPVSGRGNTLEGEDARIGAIEQILAEHMEDLYGNLPDDKKEEFKTNGEDTARKIQGMFARAKVRIKEIMYLIVSWLSFIPGINKFFIEQQAEIKANKLLALYDSSKKY